MKLKLVQNDTRPILKFVITQNGLPVDLTGATVKIYLINSDTSAVKINGSSCTIIDAVNGVCRYSLTSTDTNTVGNYSGEVEITFSDGTKQTGYKQFSVIIRDDI